MTTLTRYELITIQTVVSNRAYDLQAHIDSHPSDDPAICIADAHYLEDLRCIQDKLDAMLEAV